MRKRILVFCLVLFMLASASGGCMAEPVRIKQPDYWPTYDWQTSLPEEQGMDSGLILAMLEEIQRQNLGIHSLLIVRHGYLVTELYYPPYQSNIKHPIFSITKSVTSAMVGKALQAGYIKSLQQKVVDIFPEVAQGATDPRLKDITLEHLLTMSAGYNTNTMPNLFGKDSSFDTVREILTYDSVLYAPGTTFFYDSGLPHLLSAIVQTSSGKSLQTYTEQALFQPLGITDTAWSADPRGITTGDTGLMLRPRDMAKIGFLYLHSGQWKDKQLLPKEWVQASTSKHIETKGLMNAAEDDGYGYLWWIDAFGGYSAHGFGGQYIFVLPALDMVVVFTGGLPDPLFPLPKQLVQSYLIPAAQGTGPLAPNAPALQALASYIQAIESGDPSKALLPEIAQEISGKTYQIMPNPYVGLYEAVRLTFNGEGTYQNETLWPGDQSLEITGSLEHDFHINQATFLGPPVQSLLIPLRGYWQDEATFVEQYVQDLNSTIDLVTQKYTFTDDKVTIDIHSSMDPYPIQVTGVQVN